MSPSITSLIIIYAMFQAIICGECDMSAIVSFQDCVYYCVNKYGQDPNTQRKYYNRYNGICEKAVTCVNTPFRVYENRCLGQFQTFTVGQQQVSIPQIYQSVQVVVVHGNYLAVDQKKMCYPGFYSSNKKVQIGVQVYQQYMCDIPIGSDPQNYPTSHGQYFFLKLSYSMQMEALSLDCPLPTIFDIGFLFLFIAEVCFCVSAFHYQIRLISRKISGTTKSKEDLDQ